MKELNAVELSLEPRKWYDAKENLERIIEQANTEKQAVFDKVTKRELQKIKDDPYAILEDAKSRASIALKAIYDTNGTNAEVDYSSLDFSQESLWVQLKPSLKYHMKALRDYTDLKIDLDRHIDNLIKKRTVDPGIELPAAQVGIEQEGEQPPDFGYQEIMDIGPTKFPERYLFQKDAVSKFLFHSAETALSKNLDSDTSLNTYINIGYDELGDMMQIEGERTFDTYDCSVLNAIISLYYEGENEFITQQMVYQTVTGNRTAKITEAHRKAIDETIDKCMFSRLKIKSFNAPKGSDIEEISYEGNLIHAEKIKAKTKGNTLDFIRIISPPILYEYAKSRNQVERLPSEYLRTSVNKSVEAIGIQTFLMSRILYMKDSKSTSRAIMYEDIFSKILLKKEAPGTERQKKNRCRSTVTKILSDWEKQGFIAGFKEITEGNRMVGVIIDIPV